MGSGKFRMTCCRRIPTAFRLMRSKPRFSAVIRIFLSRRKFAGVLRKVAEGLSFECGQYGSFTVFAAYLRFSMVLCDCRIAENRGFKRIKEYRNIGRRELGLLFTHFTYWRRIFVEQIWQPWQVAPRLDTASIQHGVKLLTVRHLVGTGPAHRR